MRNIDFYKKRRIFYAISLSIIVIGFVVGAVFGIKLDIDFKGGSIVTYTYEGELDLAVADKLVAEAIGAPVTCQKTISVADSTTRLVVSVSGSEALLPQELTAMTKVLNEKWPEAKIELSNSQAVNPFIGHELLMKGLMAIAIAAVLIVAYVWISFRTMSGPSAGVMALVALFHDIVIAFLAFVIMRIPINETLVAVVLTILGFSINDTIVVYDRIRENMSLNKGGKPLAELVNQSISQSLTRTINTSICTFGAVAIAYIFAVIYGIESIRQFALPMMVGIISGSYSTICLAGPLWVSWKTRKGRTGYEA